MRCSWLTHAGIAGALLGAVGCGEQTSPDYRGESLLTFSGRVELLDAPAQEGLVPALAFPGKGGYWQIMDVAVEGEFPAGFTLHVFDPPPEGALVDTAALHAGEPAQTFAFITAVPADHAPGFQSSNSWSTGTDCLGFAPPCRRVRREFCYTERESESEQDPPALEDCYAEVRMCDFEIDFEQDQDYASCEIVETEGDASLAEDIRSRFSGFSQTHIVAYLASAAPAGSLIARILGSPEGVAPGYHLAEGRARTQAEVDAADRCNDEAVAVALERFRREHPEAGCEGIGEPPHATACADFELGRMLAADVLDLQGERKCPAPGETALSLVDTAHTRLTIRIGYDAAGLGYGPQ